jgi:hypothetical protein
VDLILRNERIAMDNKTMTVSIIGMALPAKEPGQPTKRRGLKNRERILRRMRPCYVEVRLGFFSDFSFETHDAELTSRGSEAPEGLG